MPNRYRIGLVSGLATMTAWALPLPAAAQLVSSGSGFGGAGVATNGSFSATQNPAALSLEGRGRPGPYIRYTASGLNVAQVFGFVSKLSRGSYNFGSQTAGTQPSAWDDLGGSIGISVGTLNFSWFGRGVRESLSVGAGGQMYGLGLSGYALSWGSSSPVGIGRFAFGITGRWVDGFSVKESLGAQASPWVATRSSGLAADLGMQFTPSERKDLHCGLLIQNIGMPRLQSELFKTGEMQNAGRTLFGTCLSAGVAGALGKGMQFAADSIDLGNRTGHSQFALGLSHSIGSMAGVELGYNSRSSFTVGITFLGMYARLAGRSPLEFGTNLRF